MRTPIQPLSHYAVLIVMIFVTTYGCETDPSNTLLDMGTGPSDAMGPSSAADRVVPNPSDMHPVTVDGGDPLDVGLGNENGSMLDMQGMAPVGTPLDLDAPCEVQRVAHPIESMGGTLESGADYLYVVPQNVHSLLFVFHGGNGSKEENLERRVESILILRAALERGYGVISLDSLKHDEPGADDTQWSQDAPDENPDVANVAALIDLFRSESSGVPSDAPIVVMGYSNGGSMASRTAQLPVVAAAVIYISNAQYFNEPGARIPPTVFLPGANDPGFALMSNSMYMERITESGGVAELYVNPAEAATLGLFTRIPGVDCDTSKAIIGGLIEAQWMDESGLLLRDPKSNTEWSDALPQEVSTGRLRFQIRDVLVELYGGHSPSAHWNMEVFDFLDRHRGP